jgi:hypothetical protein
MLFPAFKRLSFTKCLFVSAETIFEVLDANTEFRRLRQSHWIDCQYRCILVIVWKHPDQQAIPEIILNVPCRAKNYPVSVKRPLLNDFGVAA